MLDLFAIFLIIGLALFIGSFYFKEVNIFLLFLSGLTFILLASGMLSNHIQVEVSTQEDYIYNYTYSPPLLESINTEPVYYQGIYNWAIEGLLIFIGIFLIGLVFDDTRREKYGNTYR